LNGFARVVATDDDEEEDADEGRAGEAIYEIYVDVEMVAEGNQ
jgi:hypothetical protein